MSGKLRKSIKLIPVGIFLFILNGMASPPAEILERTESTYHGELTVLDFQGTRNPLFPGYLVAVGNPPNLDCHHFLSLYEHRKEEHAIQFTSEFCVDL